MQSKGGNAGGYRLPGSQTLELAAYSSAVIAVGAVTANKTITAANLTQDFSVASQNRTVNFKRFTVTSGPVPQVISPIANGLTGSNVIYTQVFATTQAGVVVPLTKQKQMSTVNPTVQTFRIPVWLNGPDNLLSVSPVFIINYTISRAETQLLNIPFNVITQADISFDVPLKF
jgi:hypothetical protein